MLLFARLVSAEHWYSCWGKSCTSGEQNSFERGPCLCSDASDFPTDFVWSLDLSVGFDVSGPTC